MTPTAAFLDTPIGRMLAVASDAGLHALEFVDHPDLPPTEAAAAVVARRPVRLGDHPVLSAAATQLLEYFAGRRRDFDLPLELRGTPFRLRVWQALRRIPFGATSTYARLALDVGSPSAVRAVGGANGANPVPVIVPCHRVIASDGTLCGFGGGVWRKRWLLEHERAVAAGQPSPPPAAPAPSLLDVL